MKVNEALTITGISLDGHKIPIPKGLSELLNDSRAWRYEVPDNTSNKDNPLGDYERKVVKENGQLRTYLTYKSQSSKADSAKKVS